MGISKQDNIMNEAKCSLCVPELAPKIAESEYWILILNHSQRFLGACIWVLKRHIESISELSPEEWADLHPQLSRTRQALIEQFQPDHFNYAFLQNQDRHVHMHILPRYATPRDYLGIHFNDPDYPSHYTVPAPSRFLKSEQYQVIVTTIQSSL
jgi:diadenosine tetraphosphate (Ap4A) HIT family hydrolase